MPCPVYHAGQISLRKGSIKLVDPPRNICSSLFLQLLNRAAVKAGNYVKRIRNTRLDGQFISSLRTISRTINEAERPAAERIDFRLSARLLDKKYFTDVQCYLCATIFRTKLR